MSITQIKGSQILDGSITTEDIDDGLEKDFTKVRVTTGDSSPDFLSNKLVAGSNITLTVIGSSGSSQTLSIAASGGGGGGSTSPGGSNTQVQFNDSNAFGGDVGLTYNKSTSTLSVANLSVTGSSTTISGDSFEITGSFSVTGGISGSLTRLSNGSSYLVAGSNITIVTSSAGQVTISSTASGGGGTINPGGSNSQVQFNLSGSFSGSSALTFEPSTGTLTTSNLTVGGTSIFSGDSFEVTGSLSVTNGISGSLTRLTNGSSYLVAGNNVSITTSSSGQVTISSTATSSTWADPEASYLVLSTTGSLSNERSISLGTGLTASDGGAGSSYTISLATTGPGAGTIGAGTQYVSSITVDAYGRISSASASIPSPALPLYNVASVSSTYTMSGAEDLVALNPTSVFTVYLPASPATGKMVIIKDSTGKSGTNSVTLDGNGKTIDGYNTFIFSGDYTSLTLVYTGQNWSIV